MIVLDKSCDPKEKASKTVSIEGPYGVHDTLRLGFKSVAHDLAPKHPLQAYLQTTAVQEEERRKVLGGKTLGLHMPFRMGVEKSLLQSGRRLPGLPSSNLGAEIINGTDESFECSDFLNVPAWSPVEHSAFHLNY